MKVSREQAAANRERIIDMAAELFREKGFSGIGVAELMKSAGLTHGGFYGHFASKTDLVAKACERALEHSASKWSKVAETAGNEAFARMVMNYLSQTHRDQPSTGCVLSSLGADAARQEPPIRAAVGDGFMALIDILETVAPGETPETRRQTALAAMSAMVGAILLSRLVDEEAATELLDAVKADLTGRTSGS
jgi:TetR/AcrR family transcriptional regulator, transcriptional repressor for nem operon